MTKPPKWQYPNAAERQYAADMKRMIADIRKLAGEELYPALPRMIDDAQRTDAWPEDLDAIMQRLLVFGRSRANQIVMRLPQHAERMDSFNRRQWNKIADGDTWGLNDAQLASIIGQSGQYGRTINTLFGLDIRPQGRNTGFIRRVRLILFFRVNGVKVRTVTGWVDANPRGRNNNTWGTGQSYVRIGGRWVIVKSI